MQWPMQQLATAGGPQPSSRCLAGSGRPRRHPPALNQKPSHRAGRSEWKPSRTSFWEGGGSALLFSAPHTSALSSIRDAMQPSGKQLESSETGKGRLSTQAGWGRVGGSAEKAKATEQESAEKERAKEGQASQARAPDQRAQPLKFPFFSLSSSCFFSPSLRLVSCCVRSAVPYFRGYSSFLRSGGRHTEGDRMVSLLLTSSSFDPRGHCVIGPLHVRTLLPMHSLASIPPRRGSILRNNNTRREESKRKLD